MEKRTLLFLSLFIVFVLVGGGYLYFVSFEKSSVPAEEIIPKTSEELEAEKILGEWLESSLNPEFLPPELDIRLGIKIGGGQTQNQNLYGYNWNSSGKNFYTALERNSQESGIKSYVLAMLWQEQADFNQESLNDFLSNYFKIPEIDFNCQVTEKSETNIVNICRGTWIDYNEGWHIFSAVSANKEEKGYTVLLHYLTPLESESYGEKCDGC